jgi:zinc/manganese transport system permease protein
VTVLGLAFLALVGATAAEATQAVGALLLLGLLAAPAGAAQRLAANPYRALALSAVLAVASMWLGLVLSYALPTLPPSTAVIAIAAAIYLLAFLLTSPPARRARRAAGTRLTADGPSAGR